MLKKRYRLTTVECAQLFASGKKIHTKDMVLVSLQHQVMPKCAVVVSKKLVKSAVKRNLLRRRWYSAIEESGYLTARPFQHTAFVLKAEGTSLSTADVADSLRRTLLP